MSSLVAENTSVRHSAEPRVCSDHAYGASLTLTVPQGSERLTPEIEQRVPLVTYARDLRASLQARFGELRTESRRELKVIFETGFERLTKLAEAIGRAAARVSDPSLAPIESNFYLAAFRAEVQEQSVGGCVPVSQQVSHHYKIGALTLEERMKAVELARSLDKALGEVVDEARKIALSGTRIACQMKEIGPSTLTGGHVLNAERILAAVPEELQTPLRELMSGISKRSLYQVASEITWSSYSKDRAVTLALQYAVLCGRAAAALPLVLVCPKPESMNFFRELGSFISPSSSPAEMLIALGVVDPESYARLMRSEGKALTANAKEACKAVLAFYLEDPEKRVALTGPQAKALARVAAMGRNWSHLRLLSEMRKDHPSVPIDAEERTLRSRVGYRGVMAHLISSFLQANGLRLPGLLGGN